MMCDSFETVHYSLQSTPRGAMITMSSGIHLMKDIRIRVETYDGCSTIWYEKSKLKEPTGPICERVTKQLMGLNIKRIEVDLVPAM